MSMVTIAVEGITDAAVARRLIRHVGLEVGTEIIADGCPNLDAAIPGYAAAARFTPWFVLRDLDRAECPPALIDSLANDRPDWFVLRVPVRELEAWLLADTDHLADALHVSAAQLASEPDSLQAPKLALVNAARRSTKPQIVKQLVPKPGISRVVGVGYVSFVTEFAQNLWDVEAAALRSPSLSRALRALRQLSARVSVVSG